MSAANPLKRMMPTSAQDRQKVIEGIFAINKPQWASSAGVLRDLQDAFNKSSLFAPWLTYTRRNLILTKAPQHHIDKLQVKLGHGGTLDPLATGVLIVGVGKGTKCLQRFLECTKSYECVLLFGAATDSYDTTGKVVSRAPFSHVTRELVESKLAAFRGKIMQKPSVFSALKVDGKKMYEYAREGGDIPEMPARPVEVRRLELVEWLEPGTHTFTLPKKEMGATERESAEKLMGIRKKDADAAAQRNNKKRARSQSPNGVQPKRPKTADGPAPVLNISGPEMNTDDHVVGAEAHPKEPTTEDEPAMSGALPVENPPSAPAGEPADHPMTEPSESSQQLATRPRVTESPEPSPQLAVRLRMTVTSGFYVRSLCHDLAIACDSLGTMASLVRERQGDYELGENVLEYRDLKAGEDVWEPKVRQFLEDFMEEEGWEADEVIGDDETWLAMNREAIADGRYKKPHGGRGGYGKGRGGRKGWYKRR